MSVIVVLIGFSVLVAGGFLAAFLWAVRSGQYDDRHTPSVRMLFDDERPGHGGRGKPAERHLHE
jgi:cbb3-type cytochrome oxidase maturation protein